MLQKSVLARAYRHLTHVPGPAHAALVRRVHEHAPLVTRVGEGERTHEPADVGADAAVVELACVDRDPQRHLKRPSSLARRGGTPSPWPPRGPPRSSPRPAPVPPHDA